MVLIYITAEVISSWRSRWRAHVAGVLGLLEKEIYRSWIQISESDCGVATTDLSKFIFAVQSQVTDLVDCAALRPIRDGFLP